MSDTDRPVIVDADALIALVDAEDVHATEAVRVLVALARVEAPLLYPATTIVEAITTLQRKLNKPAIVKQITESICEDSFRIEPVTQDVVETAATLFRPDGSKHNTLFDAVVAAVAKKTNARAVFSFDAWYKTQGLSLASDIF
jgi:predicted nucleic acid-binding protein